MNPPDSTGMGFNFRPPLISRTRPNVLRIHLNRLSLVPDQPVAFSNWMQEVNGRADGNRDILLVWPLLCYSETERLGSNLPCTSGDDVVFADLRYGFPVRMIHQFQIAIGGPLPVPAAFKWTCAFADVKTVRRTRRFRFDGFYSDQEKYSKDEEPHMPYGKR